MKKPVKQVAALIMCLSILAMLLLVSAPGGSAAATGQVEKATLQQPSGAETFLGGYKTVEGMQAFLDSQVAAHPTLAEKVDFGDSWCKAHGPCAQPGPTYSGYDMLALHITNRNVPGPKPVFWFDAGIHAEEIVPPELAMRFISWLLDSYDSNADAHWLVDYDDIWVVPMANPDGHHIVELGGSQPNLQRKNADNAHGCAAFSPTGDNTFGVDLNRNFPFQWACCNGASDDPCSQLYRGPSAGSEDETQAIMSMIRRLIIDQRSTGITDAAPLTTSGIAQSMHSIAKTNLAPWSFTSDPAPNGTDLNNIVAHMSAPDAAGNGYKHCQSGVPGCLGGADGDTMDWVYGELGAAAVTTEIEGDTFTPAYTQVEPVWNNNKGALVYMAKIARAPYIFTLGPDVNDLALEATVVNAGAQPRLTATINYLWQGNNYVQNVGGADYYVDVPPWALGNPKPMSAADGNFNSLTEKVEASIDTTRLNTGRHIIYVQGRGVNDFGGQQSFGPISAIFIQVVQAGGTPVASPTEVPSARAPLPPPDPLPGSGSRLFPETEWTVSGVFLGYWNKHGGLTQQGYPISPVIGEVSDLNRHPYTVQYFERAVFEYHPENAGTPYEVLLSQLGTFRYRQKYPGGAPNQVPNTSVGSVLFPETGKRVGGIFLDYWNKHGGLTQQGYPISDELSEVSDLDGKTYKVQYFERAVFEYHSEKAGTPFEVLLSQLGYFRYHEQYHP